MVMYAHFPYLPCPHTHTHPRPTTCYPSPTYTSSMTLMPNHTPGHLTSFLQCQAPCACHTYSCCRSSSLWTTPRSSEPPVPPHCTCCCNIPSETLGAPQPPPSWAGPDRAPVPLDHSLMPTTSFMVFCDGVSQGRARGGAGAPCRCFSTRCSFSPCPPILFIHLGPCPTLDIGGRR